MHTHLSKDERVRLHALLTTGLSIHNRAKQLGFSPAGISKEIATSLRLLTSLSPRNDKILDAKYYLPATPRARIALRSMAGR